MSIRNDLRDKVLEVLLKQQAKDWGTARAAVGITEADRRAWGPYADAVLRLFAVVDRDTTDVDTSAHGDAKIQILRHHWIVAKAVHHTERLEMERW